MDSPSVLVVDDEEDFVNLLLKRLKRKGLYCDGALSRVGAMAKMKEHRFDAVLLDMKLADEDGNDVLREIKQTSPGTQVIILTGYASASAGREGLDCGASDYLIKPVEFETLYERLSEACRESIAAAKGCAPETCQPNS
ncbi:MAG: response regulator [Thermoleophilia bacterium]|jgi:DNA-binding response OmpR family regulator